MTRAALVFCIAFFISCSDPESTMEMPALVAEQWSKVDFRATEYFFYDQRISYLDSLKQANPKGHEMFDIVIAGVYLKKGDYEKSLSILEPLSEEPLTEEMKYRWLQQLGLSYMRKAEQENCINHHEFESCIIPIQHSGIHHLSEGSSKAIDAYQRVLSQVPNDYTSIWLMNLAYMTLGKYPGEVPKMYLIPEAAFDSDASFPRFRDVARESGVNIQGLSGGVCVDDFNNDGFLDIISSSWGIEDQVQYLVNNRDGTFANRTVESGLQGIFGGLNMTHADYNNDGHLDFLIMRGAWFGEDGKVPNSLIRNNGDGTFTDVTIDAGVYSAAPTQTASWADVNLDGWVDLFVGNETTTDHIFTNELYINNRDGTFSNQVETSGLDKSHGYVKGCTFGDVDNDGLPDLYLSYYDRSNRLFKNVSSIDEVRFEDISRKAGVANPIKSFPTWFWDYNNDGHLDLFVSGYGNNSGKESVTQVMANYFGHRIGGNPKLYQNNGSGSFKDVTREAGFEDAIFTMGSNFGDLDNDGFLDCYLGTGDPDFTSVYPNRMYRNNAGESFQDITSVGGFGHIQKGHGIAFSDVDNDGDQDIYMVVGGAHTGDFFENVLFENPGSANSWLTLRLIGKNANRSAIGARVEIKTLNADSTISSFHHVVSNGGSFGSSSLQIEAGLGYAINVIELVIDWPYKNSQSRFQNVKVDQSIVVEEMESTFNTLKL